MRKFFDFLGRLMGNEIPVTPTAKPETPAILVEKKEPDIDINDYDLDNQRFRRELAHVLGVTPAILRTASPDYLRDNRHKLKEVWDGIQAEKEEKMAEFAKIRQARLARHSGSTYSGRRSASGHRSADNQGAAQAGNDYLAAAAIIYIVDNATSSCDQSSPSQSFNCD
jgi:hypothetical protein